MSYSIAFGSTGDNIDSSLNEGLRMVGRRDDDDEGKEGVGRVVSVVSDEGDGYDIGGLIFVSKRCGFWRSRPQDGRPRC